MDFVKEAVKIAEDFKKRRNFTDTISSYIFLFNSFETKKITAELSMLLKQEEDLMIVYVETVICNLKRNGKLEYDIDNDCYKICSYDIVVYDSEYISILENLYKQNEIMTHKVLFDLLFNILFPNASKNSINCEIVVKLINKLTSIDLVVKIDEINYEKTGKIEEEYHNILRKETKRCF